MSQNRTSMELDDDRAIVISRTFNGPARIVFDAWSKPELVKRWWAPRSIGVSMVSVDADVRVGGAYRYVLKPAGGDEFAFSGKYTEVTPHSRLAYTMVYEPQASAGEVIVTVTFEERDGKTHLVSHELYPSKEVRDIVIETGMEKGMLITMDQLDELVASLASG
ncbi:MAG TPA: SRPBCC family protein [Kofleriaceae bacterium]|nr:SRPBCC family protein [Kofleriaceae bacterium]